MVVSRITSVASILLFTANLMKPDYAMQTLSCATQVIREGWEKGVEAGLKMEAESFGKLSQTNESKALIGLYAGQTYCKKNRYGKPQKKVE